MLKHICRQHTGLSDPDIIRLENLEKQLPLMAELTGDDIFLDCVSLEGQVIVVAQARPAQGLSAYRLDIRGQYAKEGNEPAVYNAIRLKTPVRDIKAVTQENKTVRQDVVPVFNDKNQCIAALIREKDISGKVLKEKKFEELARSYEEENAPLRSTRMEDGSRVTVREVHHRVKNNLQLVASILNLQARRCGNDFTRKILQENVGRVLSIAAIHDILTRNAESVTEVDSIQLLNALRKNLQTFVPDGKNIIISVSGDSVKLGADSASSVSIVVNELITNSIEHAFEEKNEGRIDVSFIAGQRFHSITVSDNGSGFEPSGVSGKSFGLRIVEATVKDKLQGSLRILSHSGFEGTKVSFDFKVN